MKKLSIALLLVAWPLLIAVAGPAQADNEMGLYTEPTGQVNSTSNNVGPGTPFDLFLVVTNPVNEAYIDGAGTPPYVRPMTGVSGFECRIMFWDNSGAALPGLSVLNTTFNGDAIRLGDGNEFVVGFAEPVPVVSAAAVLATFSLMAMDNNDKPIYLGLTANSSIPGALAIVDGSIETDNLQAVAPSSGDLANPVFIINIGGLATETEKWGNVKALYR